MPDLSTVEVTESDSQRWNKFVTEASHSSVYHLWEWGDVLHRTYKYARHYVTVEKQGEILGIFPCLYIKSLIFGKRLISLPFVEYAGPLLRDGTESSAAQLALTQLSEHIAELSRRLKADYVEVRNPLGAVSNLLPSVSFSPLQRHVTFEIDLTKSEEELLKNMDKKSRNSLRKALRSEMSIKEVNSESLEEYYNLYLDTQKRLGSPPHSFAFFQNIYDGFSPPGLLHILLAKCDNTAVAGVIVFGFKERLYWFGNVTRRKYAHLNPTNLLLWHVIQFGIKNGFKIFDLGQTRREDEGIYHFKSGWGGTEIKLEDFVYSSQRVELPNPAKTRYVFLSKMWSRLPKVVAKRIGPRIVGGIGL